MDVRRLAAGGAAVLMVLYPVLRGYGVEDGMGAAQLYARPGWMVAHLFGMAGFVLIAVAMMGWDRWAGRFAAVAVVLVLPYYGAEAYGLHAIGRRVLETGDAAMLAQGVGAADLFRYQPVAMTLFGLGWLAFAATAVRLLTLLRGAGGATRVGLVLTALGLLTYLPQFFAPPAGRIAHGVLLAIGLVILALTGGRSEEHDVSDETGAPARR